MANRIDSLANSAQMILDIVSGKIGKQCLDSAGESCDQLVMSAMSARMGDCSTYAPPI